MKTKIARVGIVLTGALLVFLAGYAAGQRTTYSGFMPVLAAETHFNLTQRIETLARIRLGEADAAIPALERTIDAATVNLAQGKPWTELDPGVQSSLQVAKAYRSKYPSSQPDAALAALLDTIPTRDVNTFSPAMQRLLQTE